MRILLFCGNRSNSIKVLREIVSNNIEVISCVSSSDNLTIKDYCKDNNIKYIDSNNIDSYFIEISKIVDCNDYLISYLYSSIISNNFISLFDKKCINFHPSPLPEHRGVAGCCFSLLEEYNYWGVTAHQLIEKVDAGDIIEKVTFPIYSNKMFASDVENITQAELYKLFKSVFRKMRNGVELIYHKQEVINKLYTRKQLQKEKEFSFDDSLSTINKKIKALWLPPYQGLTITIENEEFTLVNKEILAEVYKLYTQYYKIKIEE